MHKQSVYCFFGIPVISMPNDSLVKKLHYLSYYPAYTLKRWLVKLYILLCVLFAIDRFANFFRKKTGKYLGKEVGVFSNLIVEHFTKQRYSKVVFFWGTHIKRKRIYLCLFNDAGVHTKFGKISFTVEEFYLIENEIIALKKYSRSSLKQVKIPLFYDSGTILDGRYIITEVLPKEAKLIKQKIHTFPSSVVSEYSGKPLLASIESVLNTSWWIKYVEINSEFSFFDNYIQSLKNKDIILTSIHGDMGSTNIFICNNRYWIIDWEQFCDNGPYLTDEISYWLGANYQDLSNESDRVFIDFGCFIEKQMFKMQDVLFALIFLIAADFNLAEIIAKNWNKVVMNRLQQ